MCKSGEKKTGTFRIFFFYLLLFIYHTFLNVHDYNLP
jgi:hypothetical protein